MEEGRNERDEGMEGEREREIYADIEATVTERERKDEKSQTVATFTVSGLARPMLIDFTPSWAGLNWCHLRATSPRYLAQLLLVN